MSKSVKNKILSAIAVLAIVVTPAISAAYSHEQEDSGANSFFTSVSGASSSLKENSLALASDASQGAAIIFESLKNFIDRLAIALYQKISALFFWNKVSNAPIAAEEPQKTDVAKTNTSAVKVPTKVITDGLAPEKLKASVISTFQPSSTGGAGSSGQPQTVVEKVIERIVEKPVSSDDAVSKNEFSTSLEQLKNKVFSEIYRVSASTAQPIYQAISLTNKIDNLNGVTISNSTVSGTFSGLTDSMIPNDITVSNYLPLGGGTLTGALTTYASATSTFAGQSLFSYVPSIAHTFSSWAAGASGANPLGAALIINPASATADSNVFSISVNDSAKFLIDAEGDVFANSITAAGGVTLSTTTASTFSVENSATFGDATTTDRTYFNSRIGSSLIPSANNLLDLGDTTNGLAWRTGIFGTSIGIGTTSPYAALSVVGETVSTYFTATSTTATSTFMGAFSIGSTTPSSSALFSVGTSSPLFLVDKITGNITINNILSILGTGTSTIAGDFRLTGASSTIKFGNSWRITPTVATTSELTVYDSSGNAAFVFDEN